MKEIKFKSGSGEMFIERHSKGRIVLEREKPDSEVPGISICVFADKSHSQQDLRKICLHLAQGVNISAVEAQRIKLPVSIEALGTINESAKQKRARIEVSERERKEMVMAIGGTTTIPTATHQMEARDEISQDIISTLIFASQFAPLAQFAMESVAQGYFNQVGRNILNSFVERTTSLFTNRRNEENHLHKIYLDKHKREAITLNAIDMTEKQFKREMRRLTVLAELYLSGKV